MRRSEYELAGPCRCGGRRVASAAVSGKSAAATSVLYTLAAGSVASCCFIRGTLRSLAARLVLVPPPLLQGQGLLCTPTASQSARHAAGTGSNLQHTLFPAGAARHPAPSAWPPLPPAAPPRKGHCPQTGCHAAAAQPWQQHHPAVGGGRQQGAARQHNNLCKAGRMAASAEVAWMAPRQGHGDHRKCPT